MNEKGLFGTKYLIGLVIAAFCIIILLILAGKLFGIYQDKNDMEKAEAHLDIILEKINKLESEKPDEYILYSPSDWMLISWPAREETEALPEVCKLNGWDDCICLCKKDTCVPSHMIDNTDLEACNPVGICKLLPKKTFLAASDFAIKYGFTVQPICINYLLEEGKKLEIKLNGDIIEISPTSPNE